MVADQTRLEQQSIVRTRLLKVKEALLGSATRCRTENHFPSESRGPGKRMDIEKNCVLYSVEFHSLATRSVDEFGPAEKGSWMTANSIQAVKIPDFRWGRSCLD